MKSVMSTKPDRDPILSEIEAFLKAAQMSASAFGKQAIMDQSLVYQLRQGRDCRRGTRVRIRQFMRDFRDGIIKVTGGE